MGHYDEQREAREQRQLEESAKDAGMTVTAYVGWKEHKFKMEQGRQLYKQQRHNDKLIAYYQAHSMIET